MEELEKRIYKCIEEVKKKRKELPKNDWIERSFLVGKEIGLKDAIIEIHSLEIEKLKKKS